MASLDCLRAWSTSQEASSYLKRALAGDPSNVRNQARLATFQRHEIDALSRLEPVSEEHVAALEKLITTLEQLALKQPKNPTLAEAWAETCLTTARLRAKTSPSRALKHLNKALSICQGQRNAIGNDNAASSFRWKLCHAACEKEAGRICKKTNDLQEANRHFDSSEKDYAALEDRLSVSETLELAELRLWKGSDKASIDNMLNDIDSRFTKRADLLKQLRDE